MKKQVKTLEFKKEVKKKYPKAKCDRDGAMFFVMVSGVNLGSGFSREAAWRSAYYQINKPQFYL